VSVAISSNASAVEASGQIQFTAAVTGSSDSAVSWAASSGTIDKTGLFTAPTTLGEVWISATSRADVTQSATAQIMVIARDISSAYTDKFDVIVDPYAINPLAAVANVRGLASADVRSVKVNVKGDGTSPPFAIVYAPDSVAYRTNWDSSDLVYAQDGLHVPIIGLLPDVENHVDVSIETRHGESIAKSLTIPTALETDFFDVCHDCYPSITTTFSDPSRMEPGWTLVELNIGDGSRFRTRPLAFDATGRVRWMLKVEDPGDWIGPFSKSINGNILTGRFGRLYEFNKLGRNVKVISFEGYSAHHEVLEIKEGPRASNLLVSVDESNVATIEDRILEFNRATGRIVHKWDLTSVLDPSRRTLVDDAVDWLHNNGIAHSPVDDTIVISGRNQGVAKVDRAGRLLWLLAPHRGWQPPQTGRLLTAVDASGIPYADAVQDGAENIKGGREFDWPWGQHSPQVLPNGDILLFDNGFKRHFDPNYSPVSRAVIYRIDESAMTVRQIWEYGIDRGADYFSPIISSTSLQPTTGHILIQPGIVGSWGRDSGCIVSEVTRDGVIVFEANVHFANRHAQGTDWGGFDMSYRAHRMQW